MKKFVLSLIVSVILSANSWAQTFEARVNRSNVPEGETFLLTVELQDAKAKGTPDFSVLNQNFTTYSVSNAYRTNIINGKVSQSQQWNLVLMPNKGGKLTIPSIALDTYKTNPITINVGAIQQVGGGNNSSQPQTANAPRFKIEAEVDNRTPYVQQQINYTLTLYDTGGLQGDAPVFLADNENDWIIKSLGEPQIDTKTVNGRSFREIKFRYAMFPQKSGVQEIPAVRFNGYYLTKERRNDPFAQFFDDDLFIAGFGMSDVFATRNPVALTAKPIKINVLPAAPENGGNWWLPAEDVKLHAEFNPPKPQFKLGEAVNRTIYLQASGVIDSQLPEIKFKSVPGLKQYPEKPLSEMRVENGKIIALEKITNVYIPSQVGDITLPEVSVNWFNVKTKTMEKATLPAMNIKVIGTPGNESLQQPTHQAAPQAPAPQPQPLPSSAPQTVPNIYALSATAFVLGILLCLVVIWLWKALTTKGESSYKKLVIRAAKEKNLKLLRDSLLTWAAKHYTDEQILSLEDIANASQNKDFGIELDKLTSALYAKDTLGWDSASFIKIFNQVCKQKQKNPKKQEILPNLYK